MLPEPSKPRTSVCNQNESVAVFSPAGSVTVWDSSSGDPATGASQASHWPLYGGSWVELLISAAVDTVHGAAVPVSKPGLPSSWAGKMVAALKVLPASEVDAVNEASAWGQPSGTARAASSAEKPRRRRARMRGNAARWHGRAGAGSGVIVAGGGGGGA